MHSFFKYCVSFSRKINWLRYSLLVNDFTGSVSQVNTRDEVDSTVDAFQAQLKLALSNSTLPVPRRRFTNNLPFDLYQLIRAKRSAKKEYQRTLCLDDKRELNRLTQLVRDELELFRNEKWQEKLQQLSTEVGSACHVAKHFRRKKVTIPPLHGRAGIAHSETEKAEVFADSLEEQCSPNAKRQCHWATPREVHAIIKQLKTRKPRSWRYLQPHGKTSPSAFGHACCGHHKCDASAPAFPRGLEEGRYHTYSENREWATDHVTRLLQEALDQIEDWFRLWRIDVNPTKSVAVLFTRKRAAPSSALTVFGEDIQWKPSAKYLGVTLDKGLRFKQHIETARNKACATIKLLYPLMNRRSRLKIHSKLAIY